MQVKTKSQSVALYIAGFFGNTGLTWDSVQDYIDSGYSEPVVLRYRDTVYGGSFCVYDISGPDEVNRLVDYYADQGCDYNKIWVNAQMPDSDILVQGEYWIRDDGDDLFRGNSSLRQMRPALADQHQHVTGFAARDLFKRIMCPRGYANFKWIREAFPGHVMEISVWRRPVGLLKWNSIVWEVRQY